MKTQRLFVIAFLVCFISSSAFAQVISPDRQFDQDKVWKEGKYQQPNGGYTYLANSGGSAQYSISSKWGAGVSPGSYSSPSLIESLVTVYNNFTGEVVYSNVFMTTDGGTVVFDLPVLEDGQYIIQLNWDEDYEWSGYFWIDNNEEF